MIGKRRRGSTGGGDGGGHPTAPDLAKALAATFPYGPVINGSKCMHCGRGARDPLGHTTSCVWAQAVELTR